MVDDDVSAHRTRTNRQPAPPSHPQTVREINQVMGDAIEDRD